MKKLSQYKLSSRFFLYLSSFWLLLLFFFNPHYIELTGTLETWFLTRGLMYYKDFAAYHFPLGRLILLPSHLLSNWNLELDPAFGLITGIGTLFLIYLFGKKFLSWAGTSIALIFFSIFFWFVATGVSFFHEILIGFLLAGVILVLFTIQLEKSLSSSKIFLLGILISLTEFSGQIATITLAIIGALTIFLLFQRGKFLLKIKNFKNTLKPVSLLTLGILIPAAILSLYFINIGAFGEFFYYNITYYLQYAGYDKSLSSLPFIQLLAFYSPFIVLSLILGLNFGKKKKPNFAESALLLLSVSSIPFIIFSVYHPHHLNYALPILALTAGFAFDATRSAGLVEKAIFLIGGVFFISVIVNTVIPWHFSRLNFPPSFRIANDLYPDSQDPMKDTVDWVERNTATDEKILVAGDPLFYLRSDRLPASRPSKGIPYAWNPFDQIKREIQAQRPVYWIIDRQFLKKLIDNHGRQDMVDFVNQELDYCYKMVATYDNWEIWKRGCS